VWKCISPSGSAPILADVRDQHDGWVLDAERAARGDFGRHAEAFGKAHLGIFVQRLIAQQENEMLVPSIEEFLLERVVNWIAQVDAQYFGPERRRELPQAEAVGFLL
jgi:hypothetical protein